MIRCHPALSVGDPALSSFLGRLISSSLRGASTGSNDNVLRIEKHGGVCGSIIMRSVASTSAASCSLRCWSTLFVAMLVGISIGFVSAGVLSCSLLCWYASILFARMLFGISIGFVRAGVDFLKGPRKTLSAQAFRAKRAGLFNFPKRKAPLPFKKHLF
jgi:hypothetical protein